LGNKADDNPKLQFFIYDPPVNSENLLYYPYKLFLKVTTYIILIPHIIEIPSYKNI